jgi:hypothetical protein
MDESPRHRALAAAGERLDIEPVFEGGQRGLPRAREAPMAQCEVCGNEYYLSFQVVTAGATHTFDSFECAIHRLAPICDHCGCKIIGHGIEANRTFYCCAHCARKAGVTQVADHA